MSQAASCPLSHPSRLRFVAAASRTFIQIEEPGQVVRNRFTLKGQAVKPDPIDLARGQLACQMEPAERIG
jgi:hypothetical protein